MERGYATAVGGGGDFVALHACEIGQRHAHQRLQSVIGVDVSRRGEVHGLRGE